MHPPMNEPDYRSRAKVELDATLREAIARLETGAPAAD
jgi:hypothetical protein